MRKKELPEVIVKAVMSLYKSAKTRVRVESKKSEEFLVEVGVHQGSVLSSLLFAIEVDVVTKCARKGLMNEILCADNLVLTSLEELQEKFRKWKQACESKGMKVNLAKTKMMVSLSEGERLNSKINPCGTCRMRVIANLLLCTKCGKWIHEKCTRMKRGTPRVAKNFVCSRCRNVTEGRVEPIDNLCDDVMTVGAFCYLGDRMNASGSCKVAITARTRIG